jgi:bacteriorhodopsin
MACIAYLVVIYQLAVAGRRNALARDQKTATFFTSIAGFTLIIWTIYPMYVIHHHV